MVMGVKSKVSKTDLFEAQSKWLGTHKLGQGTQNIIGQQIYHNPSDNHSTSKIDTARNIGSKNESFTCKNDINDIESYYRDRIRAKQKRFK
jgi:hypothetical protein